jgi:hypothetical protein
MKVLYMQNASNYTTALNMRLKPCFILGIEHRSGTNYLFHLLELHPDCVGLGPIWEDYLLHHSNLLVRYVKDVYGSWNPTWEVEKNIGPPATLLHYIGEALTRFLHLQVIHNLTNLAEPDQKLLSNLHPKFLLTKTPSVRCLENFFTLFPDTYLLMGRLN